MSENTLKKSSGLNSETSRQMRKNLGRRIIALGLAVCTVGLLFTGCGREEEQGGPALKDAVQQRPDRGENKDPGKNDRAPQNLENHRDVVSGTWEPAPEDDEFAGFYIYRMEDPIDRCESICVDYEVTTVTGEPCEEWMVYVRSYGHWHEAESVILSDGRVDERVTLEKPLRVDAVLLYPMAEGDYEWRDSIVVYSPTEAAKPVEPEKPEKPEKVPETTSEPEETWRSGSWSDERYDINNCHTWAFVLDEPIQDCEKLRVYLNIEMQHNTSCEKWSIYVWDGNSWNIIGDFYLPGGNGEEIQDIVLNGPTDIYKVTAVPKIPGNYSWGSTIAVCDLTNGSLDFSN